MLIENSVIKSTNEINVLGITFDSKLTWSPQVARAIKGANNSLQAIKLISKYFTNFEINFLITSHFYSKLYYGSEIWHLPTLNHNCKKLLVSASANALKLCITNHDPMISHVEIHQLTNRALPNKFSLYRHSLLLFKVYNNMQPLKEWTHLNFQIIHTQRQTHFEVHRDNNYKIGNNVLTNRFACLNKKIPLDWLNKPLSGFKIECKKLFLN